MKKLLLLTLLVPLLSFSGSSTTVYICTGGSSYAYHKKSNCTGLKRCKAEVKTITLEEAKKMNRKPCGYCYK